MIAARITGRRRPALSKWEPIFRKIHERNRRGKRFSIVCVAEGVRLPDVGEIVKSYDAKRTDAKQISGVEAYVAQRIAETTQVDTRVTMLGHLQRGGSPTALDRNLATRFGVAALRLVKEKKFGNTVALRGTEIVAVPLKKAVARLKLVPPDHPWLWPPAPLEPALEINYSFLFGFADEDVAVEGVELDFGTSAAGHARNKTPV